MPLDEHQLHSQFVARFGRPPCWILRAPGRVNLIGEHTDYNDGFVLPLAIDRAVWIALQPRDDRRVVVYSIDYDETTEFSLNDLARSWEGKRGQAPFVRSTLRAVPANGACPLFPSRDNARWIEYLKGTAWSLQDAGYALTGWEGVLAGDVPQGAGLSSSAALEMAAARAFAAAGSLAWDPATMARLGQRAENQWVGVNCGIMDQLVSGAARADHALLIDCRSLETRPVPLPPGVAVAVLDTATRRGLVDSEYNQRRSQCEAAAMFFRVPALRDVSSEQFGRLAGTLAAVARRRARHVITENDRTLRAAEAMRRGDATEIGRLMNESHKSLRDDYEVSNEALNAMVEIAAGHSACYGARMTGAGFGGCAVALVHAEVVHGFVDQTAAAYRQSTGRTPALYVCQATNGAEVAWKRE